MALIRRCTSLILPKYIAELSNGETFTIKRVFSLMPKYEVPEKGWTLDGNGGGMNYLATDGQDREIFRIRHPDQFWPEKFQLRVTGAGLQLPAICTAIAVDAMEEDLRRARKK